MFSKQRELAVDQLKQYATTVGLDVAKFSTCLDQGTQTATVKSDLELAQSYGVMATPTFFINGRLLSGAQPFEAFQKIIDEELARK